MRYQDLKVRDAGRLAAIAAGLIIIVAGSIIFRREVEPLINMLPMRSREPFIPIMFALSTVALLSAGMAIHYLRSSPAQNAEYIARMAARGRQPGGKFDPSLLDPSDPDFHVPTWDYLRRRRKARR